MKAKNGAMELFNVGPSFKEVLNITGLDAVFVVK
jgi:anti-anti-sigma regulatory factor